MSNPSAILNLANATITTANGSDIDVGSYNELALDATVTVGATSSYQLEVQRKGADGVYYTIYTSASLTANGTVSTSIGANLTTNVSFGNTIRIVETVTGTVSRSLSLIGK